MPFLVWFHLQANPGLTSKPPNMKAMLPEKPQRLLLRLHLVSLFLLLAAGLWPAWFIYPAALAFAAASAVLFWDLLAVTRIYRDFVYRAAASQSAAPERVIAR